LRHRLHDLVARASRVRRARRALLSESRQTTPGEIDAFEFFSIASIRAVVD